MQAIEFADAQRVDAAAFSRHRIGSGERAPKLPPTRVPWTYVARGEPGSPQSFEWTYRETMASLIPGEQPRHHHNMDQLHCIFVDSPDGGPMVPLKVTYVSEGVFYQGIREQMGISDLPPDSYVGLLVWQGGGATGYGNVPYDIFGQTSAQMEESGKGYFQNGVWQYVDEAGRKHNQDGYEAVWEAYAGKKMTYPEGRYDGVISAKVAAFSYLQGDEPGIHHKHIATFNERQMQASFIRWDEGAIHRVENLAAPQLHFLVSGRLEIGGKQVGYHGGIQLSPSDQLAELRALEPTETFVIDLPRFQA